MSGNWEQSTLGECCQIVNGGTPKVGVPAFWGGENCWITPAEMGNLSSPFVSETRRTITEEGLASSSARMLPMQSVILSSRAPIGHLVINTVPMATNQGCKGLVPSAKLDSKFLYYYLKSKVQLLNDLGTGTTFKEISGTKLSEVPIRIPPLSEQKRIVAKIDQAIEAIEFAKISTGENFLRVQSLQEAFLHSVFMRTDPTWVTCTVGEIAELKSGTTVSPSLEHSAGDVPYLKVADMSVNGNELEIRTSSRFLKSPDIKPRSVFPPGTTIFPKRGGAILTNKKRITLVPICADLNIMGVIPTERISARFLHNYFINVDMRVLGTGSSIPQINNYDIAPLRISFPPSLREQDAVAEKCDDLRASVSHLAMTYARKAAACDALKTAILQSAFTGML